MTPETADYLDKARRVLNEAKAVLAIDLTEAAGRAAYLAGFHAAQALIFLSYGTCGEDAQWRAERICPSDEG